MADYEIFREQLAIKYPSYGYALWELSPRNPNRPVQVGDVGFICEGRFYRLFSALLPADDPSQESGVPEYFEPLVPALSNHLATIFFGRNNYCSAGVKADADPGYHSSPNDFPQVLFQNETTRAAAVLSLPVMARRENTLIRSLFGQWMLKHINNWFAFARNLGLVDQMEEIILVTGCDLTRSWTNVAFLGGRADAQVSFGVNVEGPNTSINFQFSPEHARGAVLHHGPEGPNLPENQCVFIRGFRVAPSKWMLPKRLKAAAGPPPDPGGHDRDSDMEVISIPAVTQVKEFSSAFSVLSEIPKFRDPLHLLADYIAEHASDCDKILVHDDDLLMIDGIGDGTLLETLEPDVMANLLWKSDMEMYKFECDSFLTESQSGPSRDMTNVRVATLSMTFQNWNPTPPSQWPPVATQKVDLNHTSELRETPQPTIPTLRVHLVDHVDASKVSATVTGSVGPSVSEEAAIKAKRLQNTLSARRLRKRKQNATGAESGPSLWSTNHPMSAGAHGQDVNSTGALLSAYSNTTPSGPSFDPSSNLVDHVDASQASAMDSGSVGPSILGEDLKGRLDTLAAQRSHWRKRELEDAIKAKRMQS